MTLLPKAVALRKEFIDSIAMGHISVFCNPPVGVPVPGGIGSLLTVLSAAGLAAADASDGGWGRPMNKN